MKKYVLILVCIVGIIAVSNTPHAKVFVYEGLFVHYHFQTKSGEFETVLISNKQRDSIVKKRFERFKANNPEFNQLVLYRTFKKNCWKFWKWSEFQYREIYEFPYLESPESSE